MELFRKIRYYSRSDYQNKVSSEKNYEISIVKFLEFLFEKSKNKRIDIQMIYYEITLNLAIK